MLQVRVASPEEAVALANRSKYGLQGCVFTADINKAIQLSDALETGSVQINSAPARGPDHFPFQGLKDSGIGSQVGACSHADCTLNITSRPWALAHASVVRCAAWAVLTGHHQQHQSHVQDQEHRDQPAQPLVHDGLTYLLYPASCAPARSTIS